MKFARGTVSPINSNWIFSTANKIQVAKLPPPKQPITFNFRKGGGVRGTGVEGKSGAKIPIIPQTRNSAKSAVTVSRKGEIKKRKEKRERQKSAPAELTDTSPSPDKYKNELQKKKTITRRTGNNNTNNNQRKKEKKATHTSEVTKAEIIKDTSHKNGKKGKEITLAVLPRKG